jgi:hypothetical protein
MDAAETVIINAAATTQQPAITDCRRFVSLGDGSNGFAGRGACDNVGTGPELETLMARWPRHVWTSIFTYGTVFVLFPLLCLLAYAWVRGWIF